MSDWEAFERELGQNPTIAFTGELDSFDPTAPRGARYIVRVRNKFTAGEFVSEPPPTVGGRVVAYQWQKDLWLLETPANAEQRRQLSGLSPRLSEAKETAQKLEKALQNTPKNNAIASGSGIPNAGSVSQYQLKQNHQGDRNVRAYNAAKSNPGDTALLLAEGGQWVAFGSGNTGKTHQRRDIERGSPMQPPQPCKVLLYFDQNLWEALSGSNDWFFEKIASYYTATKFYFSTPYLSSDREPEPLMSLFRAYLASTGRTVAEVQGIPGEALDGVLVISHEETPFPDPLFDQYQEISYSTYEELLQQAFPLFSWQGDEDNPPPQIFSGNDVSNLRRHAQKAGVLGIGEWMSETAFATWLHWNRALFGAFGYDSTSMAVLPFTIREFESAFDLNYPTANIADERFGTLNRSLVYASTAAAYGNLPANVKGIVRARPPGEARPSWYPDTSDDFYTCVEITKLQPPIER